MQRLMSLYPFLNVIILPLTTHDVQVMELRRKKSIRHVPCREMQLYEGRAIWL